MIQRRIQHNLKLCTSALFKAVLVDGNSVEIGLPFASAIMLNAKCSETATHAQENE
jgi:hypothetical protein